MITRFTKGRRLGIAERGKRYDLPFNKDKETDFLVLLMALMTFLTAMTLTFSFVLGGIAERWSSGLENRMTIEIPAESENGSVRDAAEIETLKKRVSQVLDGHRDITSFQVLTREDVQKLLEPWLGTGQQLPDTIPLPGLIAAEIKSQDAIKALSSRLKSINSTIQIDAHERWLGDIILLTGTLQSAAIFIAVMIALATIIAVAGAVRASAAIHKADVELLHLMGAGNKYIMSQFQRHTLGLSLKGTIIGALLAGLTLGTATFFLRNTADSFMPDFSLTGYHIAGLLLIIPAACTIAALTARYTVLRTLSKIP